MAIALHENPDHDAAGAAVGLRELFVQLGVPAEIHLSPDEHLPSHTFFLDDALLVRGLPPGDATLYVLDTGCSRARRWPSSRGRAPSSTSITITTTRASATSSMCAARPSSTAEIICDVFAALDEVPSPAAATALYAGISFDSGHFRHSSTSAHTLRQAAWLVSLRRRSGSRVPRALRTALAGGTQAVGAGGRQHDDRRRRARPGEPAHGGRLRSRRCRRGRHRGDRRHAALRRRGRGSRPGEGTDQRRPRARELALAGLGRERPGGASAVGAGTGGRPASRPTTIPRRWSEWLSSELGARLPTASS